MALEQIIDAEAISLAEACYAYAPFAHSAAEDGNDALGLAVATIVRHRIISYLSVLDEAALSWKVSLSPERLQENYNKAHEVFGRWWTAGDMKQLDYLLRVVMTRAMELNEGIE